MSSTYFPHVESASWRCEPTVPVFPSSRGGPLKADALQRLVRKHVATAAAHCPSLAQKTITPHSSRHLSPMEMLRRGVDCSVIALWLGHESMETTQIYLHADMQVNEQELARRAPLGLARPISTGRLPARFPLKPCNHADPIGAEEQRPADLGPTCIRADCTTAKISNTQQWQRCGLIPIRRSVSAYRFWGRSRSNRAIRHLQIRNRLKAKQKAKSY